MATFKWDIKRKKDGVVTHSIVSDAQPDLNPAWGDKDSYDLVATDITEVVQYNDKISKVWSQISVNLPQVVIAILEHLSGDSARLNEILPIFQKIKQANPIPAVPSDKAAEATPVEVIKNV